MINQDSLTKYQTIATRIRKNILQMVFTAKTAHIGSALSTVDILVSLYFVILNVDSRHPKKTDRDRLILSKGHGAAALYATLAEAGFFFKKKLLRYCENGSTLTGHSMKESAPGIEVTTGSLGHGLAMGVGFAIAAKADKKSYRVFVILSDGELDEGSTWEAILAAGHFKLDNLVAIVDYNKIQSFGRVEEVMGLEPLTKKWKAFGWSVAEIDGHNFDQILTCLARIPFAKNKPSVVIAHTVKGKGVSFMEDRLEWHYYPPNEEQLKIALTELDSK